MKHLLYVPLLSLSLITPVLAQDEDGFSLMEQGAQLFLRGLLSEVEPAIDDLESLAQEFGPALEGMAQELRPLLSDILSAVDDIQYYSDIEILENGDILIRRSVDAPPIGLDEDRLRGSGEIDAPQIEL